jgi:hypothetical protein
LAAGPCHQLIKECANPGKLRKITDETSSWRIFPTNYWRDFPRAVWEHSPRPARRIRQPRTKGIRSMLGKLAGAWLGEKVAGRNQGAKGAILG